MDTRTRANKNGDNNNNIVYNKKKTHTHSCIHYNQYPVLYFTTGKGSSYDFSNVCLLVC